jgi:hypothetical protein
MGYLLEPTEAQDC